MVALSRVYRNIGCGAFTRSVARRCQHRAHDVEVANCDADALGVLIAAAAASQFGGVKAVVGVIGAALPWLPSALLSPRGNHRMLRWRWPLALGPQQSPPLLFSSP